ncbi:hypothetical protein RIF29_27401 [Crotalaria pallida]|uniref:RRM domain-containing protein n=1 Tax=Crotalaria pallida TaxID=3830 RepID=A0AAN9I0E7_CROPI
MWKIFSHWGSVGDVIIPKKRDKRGEQFGFVRFKNVEDRKQLEHALNSVWIGSYKVKVNSPKFEGIQGEKGFQNKFTNTSWDRGAPLVIAKGRQEIELEDRKERMGLVYTAKKETLENLKGNYIGEVIRLEDAKRMKELLQKESFFTANSYPLGGNLVLLQGQLSEDLEELIKSREAWFKYTFKEVKQWSSNIIAKERFVWIRCFGIHAHAWEEDFFNMIARRWGTSVELEKKTRTREWMNIGSFLIATTCKERIDSVLEVKIGDMLVDVKVIEDPLETLGWEIDSDESGLISSDGSDDWAADHLA